MSLAVALECLGRGCPVLPCAWAGPSRKNPLTPHGFHDASLDSIEIVNWWRRWPDALVGIPTGDASGFDVSISM